MKTPDEKQAMLQISKRLAELVNVDQQGVIEVEHGAAHADGLLKIGPFTFIIQWKGSGAVGSVKTAIEQIPNYSKNVDGNVVPLVAVPFMGEAGREFCLKAGVSWLDLSGNARIFAPGLFILIEGKPNLYKQRGRPSTAFAPKSSRVARWLLMHPDKPFTQREIARSIGMDEGYTSKVVGKLEDDGLILRDGNGAVKPRDPNLLIEAWSEDYDFSKHHILRGHVAARTGESLLRQLTEAFNQETISYATTGLAAAWLYNHFAGFRIVTLYLSQEPLPDVLAGLSFREDARGANVWLVIPNDEGVFQGTNLLDGICCVHPVQVYLDLHAHPERAREAAQRLRDEFLNWRNSG